MELGVGDQLVDITVLGFGEDADPHPIIGETSQPTLLFVMTSTCPYCARSLPLVRDMKPALAQLDVELVGLVLDRQLPPSISLEPSLMPYRVVRPQSLGEARALGVAVVPTLILTDSVGFVVGLWTGEVGEAMVAGILEEASSKTPAKHPTP